MGSRVRVLTDLSASLLYSLPMQASDGARLSVPGSPAPIPRGERIEILDVLRGFALCGILFANIEIMSGYDGLPAERARELAGAALDPALGFLVAWLVHAKFYSLFSLLFGVGFAIFMQRAEARGAPAAPLFRRRLVGLLLIGLLHSILLWFGDILHVYAVLGFLLVPFHRASPRAILRWSAIFLLLPVVLHGLLVLGAAMRPAPAGASAAPAATGSSASGGRPEAIARAVEAFSAGSYVQVVQANLLFTVVGFVVRRLLQMQALRIYGMFLLGFYITRRGWLVGGAPLDRATLRRVLGWGLAIGLPTGAAAALLPAPRLLPSATGAGWALTTCESTSALALCLAYAAAIVLLLERPRWRAVLVPLASLGRTALSNYLLQTVACVALFYGIGLGLYGRVSLARILLCAIAILLAQLVASRLWLTRFPQGPAEWAWRRFTYARHA